MKTSAFFALIFAGLALPMTVQAATVHRDELCDQLKTFETAPLPMGHDGKPMRRWVEFQWAGNWMMGGYWGCRPTPDEVSKKFYHYLRDNTNQEFHASLPMRVLTCSGYVIPTYASDWEGWIADIKLMRSDDRVVDMDVDMAGVTVDAAVRITAAPWEWTASADDKLPPPLKETPPLGTVEK